VPKETRNEDNVKMEFSGDKRFSPMDSKIEAPNTTELQDKLARLPAIPAGLLEIAAEPVDMLLQGGLLSLFTDGASLLELFGAGQELIPENIRTEQEQKMKSAITLVGDIVGGIGIEKAAAKGLVSLGKSAPAQIQRKVSNLVKHADEIITEKSAIDFVRKGQKKYKNISDEMKKAARYASDDDAYKLELIKHLVEKRHTQMYW
jgi:hypothetical protein